MTRKKKSSRIPDELLDELLADYKDPEDLTGEDGILKQLIARLVERALQAEMTEHLGYEKHEPRIEGQTNARNGVSSKTLKTDKGPLEIDVPRDRDASFEPKLHAAPSRGLLLEPRLALVEQATEDGAKLVSLEVPAEQRADVGPRQPPWGGPCQQARISASTVSDVSFSATSSLRPEASHSAVCCASTSAGPAARKSFRSSRGYSHSRLTDIPIWR